MSNEADQAAAVDSLIRSGAMQRALADQAAAVDDLVASLGRSDATQLPSGQLEILIPCLVVVIYGRLLVELLRLIIAESAESVWLIVKALGAAAEFPPRAGLVLAYTILNGLWRNCGNSNDEPQ